jgi:phosphohistidine swiveling domain-containing protein
VPPCRQLKAVANAAAQLDAKLRPAAAAGSLSARCQVWAASKFIRGAAILVHHLSLDEDVVAQLCKAAAVLLGSGGLLLQAAANKPGGLSKLTVGIVKTASASAEAADQMEAVQQLFLCLEAHPRAAAEFAASTARPDRLLGWLSSVVELLLVSEDQPSGKGLESHAQHNTCNNNN